jgi:hypothetical protein
MQALTFFTVFVLIIVALLIVRHWWPNAVQKATPIEFARVVSFAGTSPGVGVGGLIWVIFCFVSLVEYNSATTVFQQISALLLWIGGNTFCGILIVGGMIGSQAKTYVVYSDLALRMENNIARLEQLQEQASTIRAVANAVSLHPQVEAESQH